jgi:hypothetical protein
MSCDITSGFQLGCRDNAGGIKKVFILGDTGNEITTITYGGTNGEIDSLSGTGTFYTFDLVKQTSSMTETINADDAAGTVFYQQDLVLVFHKIEQEKRNQIKLLAQSPSLKVVVEDNNGLQFLLGEANGLSLSAGTAATGVAFGERNGYEITLTGFEPAPANELDGGLTGITLTGITVS